MGGLDFSTMVANLSRDFPMIEMAIYALCWLMALFFAIQSLFHFTAYSKDKVSLAKPLMALFAAICLAAFPEVVKTFTESTFGAGTPAGALSYVNPGAAGGSMLPVMQLIRLIGIIAMVRGVIEMKNLGEAAQKNASMGRAFTFLIGGVAAVNIDLTIAIIGNSMGWNVSQWVR